MKYIAAIIVFLIGIAFLCTYKSSDFKEGFSIDEECPNLLVQKGKHLQATKTRLFHLNTWGESWK